MHKAKLVAGDHMTKAPATITYASIKTKMTVRIAFIIIALNDLEAIWLVIFQYGQLFCLSFLALA